MGKYDGISDDLLRHEIARFARILQRMEAKGETLERTADILTLLGELRQMVFAWEVRETFRGEAEEEAAEPPRAPTPPPVPPAPAVPETPAGESESERIVREAREGEELLRREMEGDEGPGTGEPPSGG